MPHGGVLSPIPFNVYASDTPKPPIQASMTSSHPLYKKIIHNTSTVQYTSHPYTKLIRTTTHHQLVRHAHNTTPLPVQSHAWSHNKLWEH